MNTFTLLDESWGWSSWVGYIMFGWGTLIFLVCITPYRHGLTLKNRQCYTPDEIIVAQKAFDSFLKFLPRPLSFDEGLIRLRITMLFSTFLSVNGFFFPGLIRELFK